MFARVSPRILRLSAALTIVVLAGLSTACPFGLGNIDGRFQFAYNPVSLGFVLNQQKFHLTATAHGAFFVHTFPRGTTAVIDIDILNPPVPSPISGTMTFISSEGFKLNADLSGSIAQADDNGIAKFAGTLTFHGGTHDFARATGEAVFSGFIDTKTNKASLDFGGRIMGELSS